MLKLLGYGSNHLFQGNSGNSKKVQKLQTSSITNTTYDDTIGTVLKHDTDCETQCKDSFLNVQNYIF